MGLVTYHQKTGYLDKSRKGYVLMFEIAITEEYARFALGYWLLQAWFLKWIASFS